MYCYRRHGHNESDEPRYTQPRMYAAIDKKPTVRQMYVKRLIEMGYITEESAEEIVLRRRAALAAALDEVKQKGFAPVTYAMGGVWTHYRGGPEPHRPVPPIDQWAPEDVEAHMAFLRHVGELLPVDAHELAPAGDVLLEPA